MTQSTGHATSSLPSPKELRRLREAMSLSEEQVAAAVGVTRATVRNWETGRGRPRGRKLKLYARLLADADGGPDGTSPAETTSKITTKTTSKITESREASREAAPAGTPGAHPAMAPTPAPAIAPAPVSASVSASASVSVSAKSPEAESGPPTLQPPFRTEAPAPDRPTSQPPPAPPPRAKRSHATTRPKPAVKRAAKPPTIPGNPAPPHSAVPQKPWHAEPSHAEPPPPVDAPPPAGSPAVPEPTPAEAFDALYAFAAPALVRQTYLLTGRRRLAHESVERAFHLAWERWPEVAVDRDPAGWVRAAAYEFAMSPWQRLRRAHRHPDAPLAEPDRRELLDALLQLPPAYRRTLLLYDGVGLDLPETAAETEASTPAAANRVLHARAALAEQLPELTAAETLHERLTDLALAGPAPTLLPSQAVRTSSERRARFWTRAAVTVTTLIIGATAFTVNNAPTRYEPPVSPGQQVGGVPPREGPQRLTDQDKKLRARLLSEPVHGPARLVPQER